MDSHTLIQALIYLGAAALIVPVAVRLGLGSVLGYLIAGCVIGPWGFRLVTDAEAILHFAEIGVVLMLFVIGLELDPQRLWKLRASVFGGGALQMVACGVLIGLFCMLLGLRWQDVYLFEWDKYSEHICLVEQKTGKHSSIYINHNIVEALQAYHKQLIEQCHPPLPKDYLFSHSNKREPITRVQAFRIIKTAANYYQIPGVICCHSLRKTFGYQAWRQGVSPALLVSIYNHSSYEVTKRYLGIEQDDRDKIFQEIQI